MKAREQLRRRGTAIRERLGLEQTSDQELAPGINALLDEVVFGKLWARPGLSLEDRMLSTLCALTSVQRLPQLRTYTAAALHIGMPAELVRETMIHCAMYAGLPTALNSLEAVNEVVSALGGDTHFQDHGTPQTDTHSHRTDTRSRHVNHRDLDELEILGRETMQELHAERAEQGYASPDSAAAELYATAIQYLYGEIWNRPGITRRQRMVCSVAAFTATQLAPQQSKFFRSALNVGLTRQEVIEIIMHTGPYSGFPPALNALSVAEAVLP